MALIRKQDALDYHSQGRRGKIEVVSTKPCATQRDLSMAYTPGVAEPCREIHANPGDAYKYTAKGNLVAVVSNGTAVLGLGDIGALAGKPVMEGKGVLFKKFADVDVFDIELDTHDPEEIIRIVRALEPTFGGINLEDIKAPECFHIEEELKKTMKIPVFHDDQHGTAIISGAGLLNALEIVGKKIGDVKVVFSGAGAAGIACAKFYVTLGVKRENLILVDTKGVVYKGRKDGMNPYKEFFAIDTDARTLADAMRGADVFAGVSVKGVLTKDMVKSMAKDAIIFAMANPDPEITPEDAFDVRKDVIVATGRSDYPNQVNNVLGFPFIFRGALDVGAQTVNDAMMIAATRALADLTRQEVPQYVLEAYGLDHLSFGPEYLIPKPLDTRVVLWEAPAVAKAAIDSGIARRSLDMDQYKIQLEERFGRSKALVRSLTLRARKQVQRIVFPEGHDARILKAAHALVTAKLVTPIVLGDPEHIREVAEEHEVPLDGITVMDPASANDAFRYAETLWERRQRKGVTRHSAGHLVRHPNYFASAMVAAGDADAIVLGIEQYYPDKLHAPLQVIGVDPAAGIAAGVIVVALERDAYFLADTTLVEDPDARTVAVIAQQTAKLVRRFGIEPRVALLSFSNFGAARSPAAAKMAEATRLLHELEPDLEADGEMMAETALTPELLKEGFPYSRLKGQANVLIFPDLASANIGYQLVKCLAGAQVYGPMIVGTAKPVHILRRDVGVQDVIDMAVVAAVDAQARK